MKKRIILNYWFLIGIVLFTLHSSNINSFAIEKILFGIHTWDNWKVNADWETYDAPDYIPDKSKLDKLKSLITEKKINFRLFAGSWCGDSETELPKIYKIIDLMDFKSGIIELWGVDRNKREETGMAESFKIEKVPTLIVLTKNKEIGRITEFPETTWEDDLIRILEK